jgi:hypothetical protein
MHSSGGNQERFLVAAEGFLALVRILLSAVCFSDQEDTLRSTFLIFVGVLISHL